MKIVDDNGTQFGVDKEESQRLLEDILSRPLFAHLSTSHEKGPRDSPVWFLWENENIWIIGSYTIDSFPKRIEQDSRCAIGIVDFNIETGLVHHVGFRGKATLVPQDAERVKRLLSRYMGKQERWDPRFTAVLGDMDWLFVRFEPETIVVRDQSYKLQT
ncbi:pyridoxamine 5'-phosphate oxidase family protein [Salicibibacter cibi]|uniref:Pyridoxamine 5'-phosphate oxidase family protein n=1 Tax=Salicibibacter cibi TaxID=2743001 RepID=A0A7T7CFI3_9BACI|nr:pyridoxamine 5'-phosphate oxidase family protein [Salicibibacter cibi]QQK80024.1 pyridoxamine 5'-phosphate oxidase family protein [Salicibibacter cibi]